MCLEDFEIPEQSFPVLLISRAGTRREHGESRSTFLSKGTRYCLIPVSSLQRELSTFSDENFVLARPSFRLADVLPLVDIKAGGRKWEESSYRSRVREWKGEKRKSVR